MKHRKLLVQLQKEISPSQIMMDFELIKPFCFRDITINLQPQLLQFILILHMNIWSIDSHLSSLL